MKKIAFHQRCAVTALFTVALGVSSVANAALVDRGGGLIYDTDFNITWLANVNVNGSMTWNDAMAWASNLSYYDSVRNVTYTDWRLPIVGGCQYYNCTNNDGEMAHLYYAELGNTLGGPLANTGDFRNLLATTYWSGTERLYGYKYAFNFSNGTMSSGYSGGWFQAYYYAIAVRPGDVAAVVPEPETYAMLLAGLGLLGFTARRKKNRAA